MSEDGGDRESAQEANGSEDYRSVGEPEAMTKKRSYKSSKKKRLNNSTNNVAFKGGCPALKDNVFIHSQIHTKKWITARQKFIDYAGKTNGGNEKT